MITGFALSQGAEFFKAQRHTAKIKKAVSNELSVIKETLSNAQKGKETSTISCKDFPFLIIIYNSVKAELASSLEPQKLTYVNRAYQLIDELNTDVVSHDDAHKGYFKFEDGSVSFNHDIDEDIVLLQEAINALT